MKRVRYVPRLLGTVLLPDGTEGIRQTQVRVVEEVAWWRLVWEWLAGGGW